MKRASSEMWCGRSFFFARLCDFTSQKIVLLRVIISHLLYIKDIVFNFDVIDIHVSDSLPMKNYRSVIRPDWVDKSNWLRIAGWTSISDGGKNFLFISPSLALAQTSIEMGHFLWRQSGSQKVKRTAHLHPVTKFYSFSIFISMPPIRLQIT
jgi:hypothetical protein